MKRQAVIVLFLVSTQMGCSILPSSKHREPSAAEHDAGVAARQHFEAATAAMPRTDSDPAVADKAREDARTCVRQIGRLDAIVHTDGGRGPVYDLNKDTLNTSVGTLTLAEVSRRCNDMLAKLNTWKKLPEPAARDPEIESAFLQVVSAAYGESTGRKYLATILMTSDWGIDRADTGVVIGRSRLAGFATTKNGECRFSTFSMSQEYVGGSFTGPYHIKGVGTGTDVDCSAFPAEWLQP